MKRLMESLVEKSLSKSMSTHRQSDSVGLFTSNGVVNYTPAGSRKVLNKLVVLCQALVIGQQTAWYPPGASWLPLLLNETRKCGKLNEEVGHSCLVQKP